MSRVYQIDENLPYHPQIPRQIRSFATDLESSHHNLRGIRPGIGWYPSFVCLAGSSGAAKWCSWNYARSVSTPHVRVFRGSESRVEAARPRLPDGRAVVLYLAGAHGRLAAGEGSLQSMGSLPSRALFRPNRFVS